MDSFPLLPTLGLIIFCLVMGMRYGTHLLTMGWLLFYEATRRIDEPTFQEVWKTKFTVTPWYAPRTTQAAKRGREARGKSLKPGNPIVYFLIAFFFWPIFYGLRRRWRILVIGLLTTLITPFWGYWAWTLLALYAQYRQFRQIAYFAS